ncbi:hypothetical protein [Thalassococcus lentus]|uniref:Dihydroorotate dehydrogenase n=1 Tax=Thalassococcus lentus TaxID=1210524 RepID=A0ABT4XWN5_9RHOB|nr:hypothetical protein [Thalassococcus lentus]MDA7426385.1 hypothetical protein [Thalassococcus lentus]
MKTPPDTSLTAQPSAEFDAELDDLFAAAKQTPAMPDQGFLARLEADALAQMPAPALRVRQSLWQQISEVIGGWKGIGGLATACAAGLWLGISPPSGIETLIIEAMGGETLNVDPLSSFDFAMMEG